MDPEVNVGPMITENAARDAYDKIKAAVDEGTFKFWLAGGRKVMFSPTVLGNTTLAMAVNRSEMFAPVITLRVTATSLRQFRWWMTVRMACRQAFSPRI